MNLSFMDFLFYVPFFCTAAAVVTEILNICLVNVEFLERKKLKVKRASHFVKIRVACPHRLPKLPESTQRKQAIPNKGSLFYSHCGLYQVTFLACTGVHFLFVPPRPNLLVMKHV
jgi:hypothetical protein